MKNFVRIIALLMVAVFSLTLLVACQSMDSIKDKIKDLDEDEYMYEKLDKDMKKMFIEQFEEQLDIEFDGDIESGYMVGDEDGNELMIIEFEKSGDAKEFAKAMEEWLEDEDEKGYVEISGKIVAVSDNKKLLNKVW